MTRVKKIVIPLFVFLLLIIAGVFYWNNQADVRELNKILPEGIKVVKSLRGEYWIENRIDNYKFKIPNKWKGIEEIKYTRGWEEKGYIGNSINMKGRVGGSRIMAIDRYELSKPGIELDIWSKTMFDAFGLTGTFTDERVGDLEVIKIQEETHLLGMYVYFFKENSRAYVITCGSEEFIREIIASGKW